MKAYIVSPGVVQIGEIVYHLAEDAKRKLPFHLNNPEFIIPARENNKSAARAAMEGLYRIVFD
ncbi:MAG: hypothetical protein LUQ37_01910 [Methanoregulaceae archaeon]|nr:hypothetical protein [Methanoregulaceae archaeon]